MLIYYNYTYYITQNIIAVCFNVRLKPERETRLLNSPRFSIKFIPFESLIDNSSSGSSFTRRQRFICTATNFFLSFVSFPLPSSPPPTKRKKGWKQVRNIVHYVHKLWLPLPPSHRVGPRSSAIRLQVRFVRRPMLVS